MTTKRMSREGASQRPSDAPVRQAFTIMTAQRIQSNMSALFAGISLRYRKVLAAIATTPTVMTNGNTGA